MKVTITRNQLYQIQDEIATLERNSPGLALLLSNRIKLFKEKLAFHLKVMESRFKSIQEKYIQKDENGKFRFTGEGESAKWVFITAKEDLDKAQVLDVCLVEKVFNDECTTFFSQSISFDW